MNRLLNRFRRGMTLMEVLAAIFVISIGLLGVLAVFPFGAFQVAKGRNAEHTANMLAAAAQDVLMTDAGHVERWVVPTVVSGTLLTCTVQSNGSTNVYRRNDSDPSTPSDRRFVSGRFYMFDPHDPNSSATDPFNNSFDCFYKIGARIDNVNMWKEIMTGQDDLVYTLHDNKRTDFSGQNNNVNSSGRYTWFFTFKPPAGRSDIASPPDIQNNNLVNTVDLLGSGTATVDVDLLGCYNRTPGDSTAEREVIIDNSNYMQTFNGAQITLQGTPEALDLSKTKYIFIVLRNSNTDNHQFWYDGFWCKISYAPKELNPNTTNLKTIVVTGGTWPASLPNTRKAIIIDGILYHKEVSDLPLF